MTKLIVLIGLAWACANKEIQPGTLALFVGMMVIAWAISELGG